MPAPTLSLSLFPDIDISLLLKQPVSQNIMSTMSQNSGAHSTLDITTTPVLWLPDELLICMAKHLPSVRDIQNLRLAGSDKLARAGLDALHQRMSIIYVEQTNDSIQRFRQICDDPVRTAIITKVVYVAALQKLTREELLEDDGTLWEKPHDDEQAPQSVKDSVAELYEQRKHEQGHLLRACALEEALAEILPKLPKLKKVCFAGQPRMMEPLRF